MKIHIIKQDDTLFHLAQKYHVTVEELLKQNPNIIDPYNLELGSRLRVPSISSAMVRSDGGERVQMEIIHQHVVTSGDSMWKLSQEWGVSLADLIAANKHIHNPNVLQIGDVINIPKKASMGAGHHGTGHHGAGHHATPATPAVSVTLPTIPSVLENLLPGLQLHTVVSGDTLYHISKKYGVSLDDILALNPNITNPNHLTIGMKVLVPKVSTPQPSIPSVDNTTNQKYIVQSGDSMWKLANAWNIPLKELVAANKHIANPNVLQVGDVINIPKSYSIDLSGQYHAQQATGMTSNLNAANQQMINSKKANNQQMINSKKANNQIMPTQATPAKQPTSVQISPTIKVAPTINVTKTTAAPKQQVIATQTKPAVAAQTIAPVKVKTEPMKTTKVESVKTKVMPVANENAKVESVVAKVMPVANENAKVESVKTKVMPVANENAKVESAMTKVMPVANANAKVESAMTKVMPVANANAKVESAMTKVMPVANANAKVESAMTKVMPVANANAKVESAMTKVMPVANANAKVESAMTKVMPVANANAKVESVMTKVMPLTNAKIEPVAMKVMPMENAKISPMAEKMMPMENAKIAPMATKMMPMENAKIAPMATKMMPMENAKIAPMATKMMPMENANIAPMATKMMPMENAKIAPMATKMMPMENGKIAPMATKMMPMENANIAPMATKMMPMENANIAPMAEKMMPIANKGYAGFKPLPADLEQHPYFPNAEMLHQYQSPNSVNQANMGKFKPMMNPSYKVPVSPYPAYAPMQYYNPCGCPTYPTQGNWGYVQPMNYGNNMNPNGATITAQSAMYPPMNYGPNVQSYQNPWQMDCGCGGTPQPYVEGAANKASKLGPVTKVKKVGKKVTIQATKKSTQKPKGGKPWLNV